MFLSWNSHFVSSLALPQPSALLSLIILFSFCTTESVTNTCMIYFDLCKEERGYEDRMMRDERVWWWGEKEGGGRRWEGGWVENLVWNIKTALAEERKHHKNKQPPPHPIWSPSDGPSPPISLPNDHHPHRNLLTFPFVSKQILRLDHYFAG